MRVLEYTDRDTGGPDRRDAVRRGSRARAANAGVVVMVVALGACASRVPAPVESRSDVPAAPESSAAAPESSVPASLPVVPEASPQAVESAGEVPVTESEPAAIEVPFPEPEAAGGTAVAGGSTVTRLAALNPAIVDLLNAANEHSAAGRHDGAAAALERALKIEPADPGLWHRLAQVRFAQGKPDLAGALAAKSNSLAAGDENLRAQNWGLIAKVRRKLGDTAGAEDAAARASRLLD